MPMSERRGSVALPRAPRRFLHPRQQFPIIPNDYEAARGEARGMSARANPYDNAWTESFIGTLKNEMLQDGCFESADDARTELFD